MLSVGLAQFMGSQGVSKLASSMFHPARAPRFRDTSSLTQEVPKWYTLQSTSQIGLSGPPTINVFFHRVFHGTLLLVVHSPPDSYGVFLEFCKVTRTHDVTRLRLFGFRQVHKRRTPSVPSWAQPSRARHRIKNIH